MNKLASSPILVGVPATIPIAPLHIDYLKGSAPWLNTVADRWEEGHQDLQPVLISPSYERLEYEAGKRLVWPITYQPPTPFAQAKAANGSRWNPVASERIDIKVPIQGFTRSPGLEAYGLSSEVTPQAFRAITETTAWYLHWLPALLGRERFDVLFPQHILWNMIAGAAYFMDHRAFGVCHETCARVDMASGEGGFSARNVRAYARAVLAATGDEAPIVAISDKVFKLLTEVEDGPSVSPSRVAIIRNPYNDKEFHPIPGMTKLRFLQEHLENMARQQVAGKITKQAFEQEVRLFGGLPTDGRWVTFVGSGREFKGVEQALRAWAAYLAGPGAKPDDILFMVGPNLTEDSDFAQYASELGIDKQVRFIGKRDKVTFINVLHNAGDLALMTSLEEGDGVVAKEPAGANKRVLVPASGGPKEIVGPAPVLGQVLQTRDPRALGSLRRGIELLGRADQGIQWGNVRLSGPEIVSHYLRWRAFYESGTTDPALLQKIGLRNERLSEIIRDWSTDEGFRIRQYALKHLLSQRPNASKYHVPTAPVPLHEKIVLLADVFRIFGGMDVEVKAFGTAIADELRVSPELRRTRGEAAGDYARANLTSGPHAAALADLVRQIARRPVRAPMATREEIAQTVVGRFGRDEGVAAAFTRLQQAQTPQEFVAAVDAFNRSVVSVLGNPANYEDRWPLPSELGMGLWGRMAHVAAHLADVPVEHYEAVRVSSVAREAALNPVFTQAFYLMHLGETEMAMEALRENAAEFSARQATNLP